MRKRVNPYYEKEFRYLELLLGEDFKPECIVDVGGNLGQSTIAMSKIFRPREIFIFEPNAMMASECRKIKKNNGPTISVQEFGLGKSQSENLFFTPSYNGITFWGLASTNKEHVESFFGPHNIWNFKSSKFRIIENPITIKSLDSYQIKPNFIKIDVEGMELEVLAGAEKSISGSMPVIMVECTGTHRTVKEILEAKGYKNFELEKSKWVISSGKNPNQIFAPTQQQQLDQTKLNNL